MIQISNPIEPTSHQFNNSNSGSGNVDSANRPNAGGPAGVFSGPQKKNRLGVFAKLLDGLSAKLTRGTGESGDSETDEISGPGTGKNTQKLRSNVKKPGEPSLRIDIPGAHIPGINIPNTESPDAGNFLFPGQKTDAAKAAGTEVRGNLSFRLGRGLSPNGTPLGENFLQEMESRETNPPGIKSRDVKSRDFKSKEDFPLLSSVKEKDGEGQNPTAETGNRAIGSGGEKQGTAVSAEKAKNTRNAFINVSFREMEAEAVKNQSLGHLAGMNPGQKNPDAGMENSLSPEPRGKKGRERLALEVRDLRTGNVQRATSSPESGGASKEAGAANVKLPGFAEIEIPVDLNSMEISMGSGKAAGEAGNSPLQGRTFEDLLAAQLRGDLSADIVRDASVIVRNGGEGTIRLSLRPASLGDVKIHLEMAENKITGHIILESDEALRAFQRELPVLEKAFRDSGYSETSLDMSLAQNGDSGSHGQRQEGNFLSHSLAASRYDSESYRYGTEPEAPISGAPVGGVALPTLPGRTPVYLLV